VSRSLKSIDDEVRELSTTIETLVERSEALKRELKELRERFQTNPSGNGNGDPSPERDSRK
jgi:regulator of replication initiation timing